MGGTPEGGHGGRPDPGGRVSRVENTFFWGWERRRGIIKFHVSGGESV